MIRPVLLLCGLLLPLPSAAQPARLRRHIQENGPALNGTDLGEPRALASATLKHVLDRDGKPISGVVVRGGALWAPEGAALAGAQLDGMTTPGLSAPASPVRLRIDAIIQEGQEGEVSLYRVSYQERKDAPWRSICQGGELAVALAGTWDYHAGLAGDSGRRSANPAEVTFACERGALSKCVRRHGYHPWKGAEHDTLHQACVRATRADYCGTGESMTQDRTRVEFHDSLGIQRDTSDWTLEAVWTPKGASCVRSTRLEKEPVRGGDLVARYLLRTCREVLRPCAAAQGPTLTTEHGPRQ